MYAFKKIKWMCLTILLSGTVLLVCPLGCINKEEKGAETATTVSLKEEKEDYESTAQQQPDIEQKQQQEEQAVDAEQKAAASGTVQAKPAEKVEAKSGTELKMDELLKDAFQWKLLAENWYGKWAGNFTLTDINGKVHRLSDYRGKDVIVLSWAVWCPGSRSQVAILNEIRERIGEDKLAILGVCYKTNTGKDTLEMVKEYAAKHKIRFPVFYVALDAVPSPFDMNIFVPASYFIDSRGNLKLAVENIVSIKYVQKVLEAKR